MKIAILTQPLKNNYGGALQAYALQMLLTRMGHDVLIIRREYSKPSIRVRIKRLFRFFHTLICKYLLGKKYLRLANPFSLYYDHLPVSKVHDFTSRYVNQSKPIFSTKELSDYFDFNVFDAYIVGSDQVWRPAYSPCITNYFFDCIAAKSNVKRIAYAASFGTSQWEYSHEQTEVCSKLAQLFDAISVREDSGVNLCGIYLKVNATHVLDPTMLLQMSDYLRLINVDESCQETDLLTCYILDDSEEKKKMITSVSNCTGCVPYYSNARIVDNNYLQLTVEEWLDSFRRSKFVVVDSFHGCVFSILFEKPFIVYGNNQRGLSRFESILRVFGLQNRIVTSYDDFLSRQTNLLESIDYSHVRDILAKERTKSLLFLENALK